VQLKNKYLYDDSFLLKLCFYIDNSKVIKLVDFLFYGSMSLAIDCGQRSSESQET